MADLDKDFDLLAGHDLGQSRAVINVDEEDPDKMDVLVWHKLETVGYHPSAREVRRRNLTFSADSRLIFSFFYIQGHTAVTNGFSVLVFGGFEAGQVIIDTLN